MFSITKLSARNRAIRRISVKPISSLIICLVITSGLTVSARALLLPASVVNTAPPALIPEAINLPSADTSSQDRIEAEMITITSNGFEPTEIRRPRGRFILAIENRSDLEEVSLQLNHESGNREREIWINKNHPDWREVIDLQPGSYTLRDANHPAWSCAFVINEQ